MRRIVKSFLFLIFYGKEVLLANAQIAWQIMNPSAGGRTPGFLSVSVEGLNERQLLIVTNLITMTPGTLSFEVSTDGKHLLIHQLIPGSSKTEDRMRFEENYIRRVREIF